MNRMGSNSIMVAVMTFGYTGMIFVFFMVMMHVEPTWSSGPPQIMNVLFFYLGGVVCMAMSMIGAMMGLTAAVHKDTSGIIGAFLNICYLVFGCVVFVLWFLSNAR